MAVMPLRKGLIVTLHAYFREIDRSFPVRVRSNQWFSDERGIDGVTGTVLSELDGEYVVEWDILDTRETFDVSGGMSMQLNIDNYHKKEASVSKQTIAAFVTGGIMGAAVTVIGFGVTN